MCTWLWLCLNLEPLDLGKSTLNYVDIITHLPTFQFFALHLRSKLLLAEKILEILKNLDQIPDISLASRHKNIVNFGGYVHLMAE